MKNKLVCYKCLEENWSYAKVEGYNVATCMNCGTEKVLDKPRNVYPISEHAKKNLEPIVHIPWKKATEEQIKKYGIDIERTRETKTPSIFDRDQVEGLAVTSIDYSG